ncbi:MAG TPA: PKD domain-containing protein, partial [Candidatus Thermoplasmatota archaeon]|nr:PKD domain-containing protein [Candidatus Thermoplasmatota archaeon]
MARIDPASTAPLRHLAYLGASTAAFGRGVAVDGRSVTYLAGDTAAFTPTAGAVQPTAGGGLDGFLAIYGKRPPAAAFEAKPQGGTTHAVPPAAEASFLSLTSVALSSKAQAGDVAIASTAWRLARYGSDVWSGTGETATIPASILTPGTYELCHDAVDADVRTPPTDHLGTECLQLAVQNRPPSADILLPSTVVLGTPATFQSQATDLDGSIVVQQWQFGDGGTASGPSATYTFAAPGATTVLLVVKDDLGAAASVTKTVNVLRPPQASFEHTHPAYSGFVVTFQDTSSAGSLPIESWVWQFPGEAPVYGRGPHHRILPVGEHVVQLTVKTAVAQSVATAHVEVRQADPTPVPDEHSGFQGLAIEVAAPGPLGNDENPYNLELTMDVTRLPRHGTLLWHADGSFTYQPEPGFVGDDAFEYTIPRATKGATVALRVLAFPPPVAAFTAEAYDLEVRFRDESRTSHHPIVLWEWEFGDGWRGNGPSPTHTYREPGIHLVWLTVTDASGASNRTWRHVLVEDIPGIVPEALTGRSPAGGAGAAAAQQGGPAVLGGLAAGGLRAAPAPAQPEAATPPPPQQAAPAGLPAWLAARPDAAPAPAAAGAGAA